MQYGIDTLSNYPYISGSAIKLSISENSSSHVCHKIGKCRRPAKNYVKINGPFYNEIKEGTENQLKFLLAKVGPIGVSIHATDDFRDYKSGIFYDSTCDNSGSKNNHAVTVVGYGTDGPGKDYWLIKNSWGTDWVRINKNLYFTLSSIR